MRQPAPLFVMLNPSTADAMVDDATIRKCRGFSERWGYEGIKVVNLYAFRGRDPADLKRAGYPGGPRNDAILTSELMASLSHNAPVVVAWGAHAEQGGVNRFRAALETARGEVWPMCLGTTKSGQPKHPLMLAYSTPLEPWS